MEEDSTATDWLGYQVQQKFVSSYQHGDSNKTSDPQISLLEDEAGRKKSTVTLLLRCEFETISSPKNKMAKLLQTYPYKSHHTSQSHPKISYEEKHAKQEISGEHKEVDCISHPDLEDILPGNLYVVEGLEGRKSEDLSSCHSSRIREVRER